MPITLQSLADLDQGAVDAEIAELTGLIQEAHPDLELKRGTIRDLMLVPSADLAAANQANIDLVRRSNSLLSVSEDPTLANDDVLNRLASNYRVTRIAGVVASGTVTILLTRLVTTTINTGQAFTDPTGQVFVVPRTIFGKTSSLLLVGDDDRLISAVGDGTFSFNVPATSQVIGTAGNIPRLTELLPSQAIPNFDSSFAGSDFISGRDEETNTELLTRIQTSLTPRSVSNRPGIEGLIRAEPGFEDLPAISTIGFGDAEQRRYHSILPIALPGRVDAYVRTELLWQTATLTKTATLIGTAGPYGLWQFTIGRDDVPGYYEIEKIVLPVNATNEAEPTYAIDMETRGYDITEGSTAGTQFFPDITASVEAVYSRYQTAVVSFIDTDTDIGSLIIGTSTNIYTVMLRQLPGLDELQDVVADLAARSVSGDLLLKVPVPCFMTVETEIGIPSASTVIDSAAMAQAIADAINNTGISGRLSSPVIAAAIQTLLPVGSALLTTDLAGRVRYPDGTNVNLSSSTALDVGNQPEDMVTSRTVSFFCRPDDVTVTTSLLS